mmetsp:Transcript_93534/g.162004  ORF Transcript_93534/g.162004 Transcript_93534/m.162004 type:complete len:100 (-) Transcript_93534:181-480(-)
MMIWSPSPWGRKYTAACNAAACMPCHVGTATSSTGPMQSRSWTALYPWHWDNHAKANLQPTLILGARQRDTHPVVSTPVRQPDTMPMPTTQRSTTPLPG